MTDSFKSIVKKGKDQKLGEILSKAALQSKHTLRCPYAVWPAEDTNEHTTQIQDGITERLPKQ